MPTLGEARHVIQCAIEDLRDLAAAALQQQDYIEVVEIAKLADELSNIVGITKPMPPPVVRPRGTPKTSKSVNRIIHRRSYPIFERDGDKLVKIGWSKKARKEYQHRAPYKVSGALLDAIRKKVSDGEFFTAPDILPVNNIPDHQAYLALKWLQTEGMISKHGRDRYAIEPGKLTATSIDDRWQSLPKSGITNG